MTASAPAEKAHRSSSRAEPVLAVAQPSSGVYRSLVSVAGGRRNAACQTGDGAGQGDKRQRLPHLHSVRGRELA